MIGEGREEGRGGEGGEGRGEEAFLVMWPRLSALNSPLDGKEPEPNKNKRNPNPGFAKN